MRMNVLALALMISSSVQAGVVLTMETVNGKAKSATVAKGLRVARRPLSAGL